ncbi:phosphatase PAP2 family protein [Microlunatus flavus]|uniref:PAP2 superfamily protein n=1 Tax=Microlunatus flavus TaxID=1036181 RepID=A0A1H9LT00_9ACTN|nr:hypothetical protein [Microlunatus flavus]SER14556.1 hypothetical protein SAMN05421756_109100 [Microlunatus flavus]
MPAPVPLLGRRRRAGAGPPAPPPTPQVLPHRVVAVGGATVAAAALALFGVVAAVVLRSDGRDRWDAAVRRDLGHGGGPVGSEVARVAVGLATPLVLVLVTVVAVVLLWRWAHRPLLGAAVLGVAVATAALVQLLALALGTVRPAPAVMLGVPLFDGSFPSVRTADAEALWGVLALAGVLLVHRGSARAACLVAGLLLSAGVAWGQLDRAHAWPTDVLGGWLLGLAAAGVAAALVAAWPVLPTSAPPTGRGDEEEHARDGGSAPRW